MVVEERLSTAFLEVPVKIRERGKIIASKAIIMIIDRMTCCVVVNINHAISNMLFGSVIAIAVT
jgi:hypothetical protein